MGYLVWSVAEGSASDEAHAARAQSEAEMGLLVWSIAEGSASDEAHAARAQSEAEGEPARERGAY